MEWGFLDTDSKIQLVMEVYDITMGQNHRPAGGTLNFVIS